MDRDQPRRRDGAEQLSHQSAPIATLRHEARIAEPLHQRGPSLSYSRGIPAGGGWPAGEAVSGDRRNDHVERVLRGPAMGSGVGQWPDDLEPLDDRPRPAVSDDDRQRVLMLRADVDEMDVQP